LKECTDLQQISHGLNQENYIDLEPMMKVISRYIHSLSIERGARKLFHQFLDQCCTSNRESLIMEEYDENRIIFEELIDSKSYRFLVLGAKLEAAGLNAFTHSSVG
jgi:hypothetical protein